MKANYFLLRSLSPVHIGCDEAFEISSYTFDGGENKLKLFDLQQLFRDEQFREQFSTIASRGSIDSLGDIARFLKKIDGPVLKTISASKAIFDHYNSIIADRERSKQGLKQFSIGRTSYQRHDLRAYVPGSSIKGALRTAFLNQLADKSSKIDNIKDIEGELLGGKFSTDPFRGVKVSDFMPVGHLPTRIAYAVNRKKNTTHGVDGKGMSTILEFIEPGALFLGSVQFLADRSAEFSVPVKADNLFKASSNFYKKQQKREHRELDSASLNPFEMEVHEGECLLRVGRHSGFECVTIEKHCQLNPKGGKGRDSGRWGSPKKSASTFWLSSPAKMPDSYRDLLPCGWVVLKPLSDEEYEALKTKEEKWLVEQEERKEEEQKRRASEQKRQREAEEEKKRRLEEEAQKAAQRASLPPEQQKIARFGDADVTENEVTEIFKELDSFEAEDQKRCAEALKRYWVANAKWDGGGLSKKQKAKISKIKAILDE